MSIIDNFKPDTIRNTFPNSKNGLSGWVSPDAERTRMKATKPRCGCGFMKRGKRHEDGPHHKNGKNGRYTPPQQY